MSSSQLPKPMVSPERVDAMWKVSASRILVGPRRRRAALRAGALSLVVGLGGAFFFARPHVPSAGSQLAAADQPSLVTLADGSEVSLAPRTSLLLDASAPDEVSLSMRGGRARFSVTHKANRVFKVRAGNVEVRVLGTRFGVDTAHGVEVWVEEGVVEVRTGDRVVHLHVGESWKSEGAGAPPPAPTTELPEEPARAAAPAPLELPLPPRQPATHAAPARAKASPSRAEASGSGPSGGSSGGASSRVATAPLPPTRDELFGAALEARRAGRAEDARTAWSNFLARAPDDPRASLAAFELGRIAMDVDHQDTLALSYLERALASSPASAFAEDALARVVRLNAKHGSAAACRQARDRYASQFPHGTYAASIGSLCP
jgi:transmembrane sensor